MTQLKHFHFYKVYLMILYLHGLIFNYFSQHRDKLIQFEMISYLRYCGQMNFNFSYSLKTEQVQYYSLILLISSFTLVFLELNIFVLTLIDVLQVYCLLFKISY